MEIRFPCSETELSKKLSEIKMNPEYLAPMAMVLEIEPAELSVLTDCDVSLDALNYLGKDSTEWTRASTTSTLPC